MKIVFLNGNPDPSNTEFDSYLANLSDTLESHDHKVNVITLRDLDIRYCIGCFGCWLKTPGECSTAADDSVLVRREAINSDLLIFTSPVIMGFASAILKKVQDRLLPLILPYIGLYKGESRHRSRYDKRPLFGLILQPDSDTDTEDIEIVTDIYRRLSLNIRTDFVFSKLITTPVNEIADEINNL